MARRAVIGVLGVAIASIVAINPVPADAAPEPLPATLTGLRVDGSQVSGVVTVRASGEAAVIDPASVTVTVGGTPLPATVTPAAAQRRVAVLVVDTSGSMGKSGMRTVREAVAAYLAAVPRDVEVGLVSFAATAGVEVAPTRDRAAVQAAAGRLTSLGDTALYDGLAAGLAALGDGGDRSVVLLSDGKDNRSKVSAAQVVERITSMGARTDVIGFNFASQASADRALREVAQAGGGTVAAVNDSAAVTAVFAAAARAIESQAAITVPVTDMGGPREVVVSGQASGASFRAAATVDFGAQQSVPSVSISSPVAATAAGPPTAAAGPVNPGPVTTPWWFYLALAAIFVGIFGGVGSMLVPTLKSQRALRVEGIEAYVAGRRVVRPVAVGRSDVSESMADSLVRLGDRAMQGRASTSATMALLQRADLPWRAGEWAILRVVGVLVGVAIGVLALRDGAVGVIGAMLGGLLGLIVPPVILRFLARRRSRAFERQLPDVLMLVASSLSTGFSLLQAMDAVSRDVAEPAAKEFARVMAETRIGSDIESAIGRLADRMSSENMRWTSMAIAIQRQVGGNLAETLRTTATTLREREVLRRHVNALSAEGRLSAVILVALPMVLFVYELNVNRAYISLLWTTLLGLVLLIVGALLMAIGVFWLSRAIRVEV